MSRVEVSGTGQLHGRERSKDEAFKHTPVPPLTALRADGIRSFAIQNLRQNVHLQRGCRRGPQSPILGYRADILRNASCLSVWPVVSVFVSRLCSPRRAVARRRGMPRYWQGVLRRHARRHRYRQGPHRNRILCERCAEGCREFSPACGARLLQRFDVPPDRARVHDPGGRPQRGRHRRGERVGRRSPTRSTNSRHSIRPATSAASSRRPTRGPIRTAASSSSFARTIRCRRAT